MGGQTQAGSASGGMSTAGDAGSGRRSGRGGRRLGWRERRRQRRGRLVLQMGTQADPGRTATAKSKSTAPTSPRPETQMHLNNAPVGKINDMPIGAQIPAPLIYAATKQYPGLNSDAQQVRVLDLRAVAIQGRLPRRHDGVPRRHALRVDRLAVSHPGRFDNLIASGDIPVTIGVFINPGEPGSGHYDGNEQPNRSAQYDRIHRITSISWSISS